MKMLGHDIHQVRRDEGYARIDSRRGRQPPMDGIDDMGDGQTDQNTQENDQQEIHTRLPENELPGKKSYQRKTENNKTGGIIDQTFSFEDRRHRFGHFQVLQDARGGYRIRRRNDAAQQKTQG